jgi:hypothetical protein
VHNFFLLEARNSRKASIGAGLRPAQAHTMAAQQAVAKSLCWKARQLFDAPFF